MAKDFRIIVLISGRGSNLKSLIQQCESFKIVGVLSNKPEAPGLAHAKAANIPCFSFDRKHYESLPEMKAKLLKQCQELKPDLVVLAGFMQILDEQFIAAFPARIVNIHPSLLPNYPGVDTHARALKAHEKIHGCSVHIVDRGIDTGQLIAQASCECRESDDVDSLSARVLELEHKLYPWVVNNIARSEIKLGHGRPKYSAKAVEDSRTAHFTIFSDNSN
jgi:phosphoribosylglycinamide formyltransferase-1